MVVDALVQALSSERNPTTRACIIETLGEGKDASLALRLVAHLADEETVVRMHCCRALGVLGNGQVIRRLREVAVEDSAFPVRFAASVARMRLAVAGGFSGLWERSKSTGTRQRKHAPREKSLRRGGAVVLGRP